MKVPIYTKIMFEIQNEHEFPKQKKKSVGINAYMAVEEFLRKKK